MKPGHGKKVLIAMSGGVDSSVAAALLKQDGYDVVGCFMRLGSEDSVESDDSTQDAPEACDSKRNVKLKVHHQGCCSINDASDARMVAGMLDVPFYVLNFKKDFGRIINYFVDEYNAGRTPNPCVRCNDWLKFGKLADYARHIDADYVATGHYARVEHSASGSRLLRGKDYKKDQSYVLFGTKPDSLAHMLLPIGELEKPRVRELAEEFKLPVFDKPDSQEICFVPDNDYARLVAKRTPEQVKPGNVLDRDGKIIGQHVGHQHYTIGQRRGIGVAVGHPIYVTNRDAETNTITIGLKEDLLSASLTADQCNWLVTAPTEDFVPCQAKIRYNSVPVAAHVRATANDTLEVRFDEPQSAVTPGQAVVLYDHDTVMGGGWINARD